VGNVLDDVTEAVNDILSEQWEPRRGYAIPPDVGLESNDGILLDSVAVMYADLKDSTGMVNGLPPKMSAEIYRAFLAACGKLVNAEGGSITAYDGDRIMAVFGDENKEDQAVRCAMKIQYVGTQLINPRLKTWWPAAPYEVKHVVGIDVSKMLVARTGVRGANDLVWVGTAANYAAKLATLGKFGHSTYITPVVLNALGDACKFGGKDKKYMWEETTWDGRTIHRSAWRWTP